MPPLLRVPQPVTVARTPAYVALRSAGRQAGLTSLVRQTKDGVVIVDCSRVVLRVVDDLCNVDAVEVAIGDVVLSKDDPDAGSSGAISAMGGGEDVG